MPHCCRSLLGPRVGRIFAVCWHRFWVPSQDRQRRCNLNRHSAIYSENQGCHSSHARGEQAMTSFFVNGKAVQVDVDPSTPLLWVIRESLGLTGTKFGCGMALCGACTVHLEGKAVRSCVTPVRRAAGKKVVTIEGLSTDLRHPLQVAWIEADVPQCGYCQSGQIMAAAGLLRQTPRPTDAEIDNPMCATLGRCGTYARIRKAIHAAAALAAKGGAK